MLHIVVAVSLLPGFVETSLLLPSLFHFHSV